MKRPTPPRLAGRCRCDRDAAVPLGRRFPWKQQRRRRKGVDETRFSRAAVLHPQSLGCSLCAASRAVAGSPGRSLPRVALVAKLGSLASCAANPAFTFGGASAAAVARDCLCPIAVALGAGSSIDAVARLITEQQGGQRPTHQRDEDLKAKVGFRSAGSSGSARVSSLTEATGASAGQRRQILARLGFAVRTATRLRCR
jgi:hypothetical protein